MATQSCMLTPWSPSTNTSNFPSLRILTSTINRSSRSEIFSETNSLTLDSTCTIKKIAMKKGDQLCPLSSKICKSTKKVNQYQTLTGYFFSDFDTAYTG